MTDRLIVVEDQRFDERAKDNSWKGRAFRIDDTHRHLKTTGAVREGLSRSHSAPLSSTIWLQTLDALLYFFHMIGVEEIFYCHE